MLERVDTLDASTGAVLASRSGEDLTSLVKRPEGGEYRGTLGPGPTGIVVLDVALPCGHRGPRELVHRIVVDYDGTQLPPGLAASTTYRTARTTVVRERALALSPPLRGRVGGGERLLHDKKRPPGRSHRGQRPVGPRARGTAPPPAAAEPAGGVLSGRCS